jgi:hypothetical protein
MLLIMITSNVAARIILDNDLLKNFDELGLDESEKKCLNDVILCCKR